MTLHPGNLGGKPPLGLKTGKPAKPKRPDGKDPAYLAAVRSLPCCICAGWGYIQQGPTFAHHTICGRYGQRKTPDRQAIPLCFMHHQGDDGIHVRRAWWVEAFGPDTDFIAATQDAVDGRTWDQIPGVQA